MSRKAQPPVKLGMDCPKCGADEWLWHDKWRCGPCNRERWRTRPNGEPNSVRLRRQRYGLTPEQYDAMLTGQRGRCAICGDPMTGSRGPMVDHCHATNEVRGLLCQGCNTMLGAAKDEPARLGAAAAYLKRHHPERFAV